MSISKSTRRVIVAIVLLVVSAVPQTFAQVSRGERDALIAFFNSTNGIGWFQRPNWLTPDDSEFTAPGTECDWYGVSCNQAFEVTSIEVWSNNLAGPLPPEIGNFPSLEELVIVNNRLDGSLPPELALLPKLTFLRLSTNELTGTIPPQLGQMPMIEYIDLSYNSLSGEIPSGLGQMTTLESLYLSHNALTGEIPPELGSMTNLENLGLSDNELSGHIPPELANLQKLLNLNVTTNQLTGTIPAELNDLPNFAVLYVFRNKLAGELPDLSATAISIGNVGINFNGLFTDDPVLAAYWTAIDPDWEWSQTIPPKVVSAQTSSGSSIFLYWIPVVFQSRSGGYIVEHASAPGGPYTSLIVPDKTTSFVYVDGYGLGETVYARVSTYTDPHQQNANTVISVPSPEVSATTEHLVTVGDISFAEGDFGTTIAQLTITSTETTTSDVEVEYTTINKSALAGEDFIATSGTATIATGSSSTTVDVTILGDQILENDEVFWFKITNVVGAVIGDDLAIATILNDDRMLDATALMALYEGTSGATWQNRTNWRNAGDTDFNSPGTECSWYGVICNPQQTAVTEVHLADNGLFGSIPVELGTATSLRVLDLSGNSLSGELPIELSYLTDLVWLQLGDNRLSGKIPEEFADLTALQSIDLDRNALVGELPDMSATQLVNADIRYNGLFSTDPVITSFWDLLYSAWSQTQTTAPSSVVAAPRGADAITLSWSPMTYQLYAGGYVVEFSTNAGGPYSELLVYGKATTEAVIAGFELGTTVYARVSSYTGTSSYNKNEVTSSASPESSATTALPFVSLDDSFIVEGDSGATSGRFTLRLNAPSNLPVEVDYWTTGGLAIPGVDYQATAGRATIPGGVYSHSVDIVVFGDLDPENDETFDLKIDNPESALITRELGTVTIINDDGLCPAIVVSNVVVTGSETLDACGDLVLGPDVTVTPGAVYSVSSPRRVSLGAGFSIEPGATFRLEIRPHLQQ